MPSAPRDLADRRPRPRRGSPKRVVAAGWGRGPLPRAAATNRLRRAGRRSTDSGGREEEAVLVGVVATVVPVLPHRVPAISTPSTIFGDWVLREGR